MTKRASIDETLAFANKVREAGGATPLLGLMPAIPQDANSCLIAKNLNFDCEVAGVTRDILDAYDIEICGYENNDLIWGMFIDDEDTAIRISESLGLPLVNDIDDRGCSVQYIMILPAEIGKVAQDFDRWLDDPEAYDEFTEFVDHLDDDFLTEIKANMYKETNV